MLIEERHFTPKQLSKLWNLSVDSIRSLFRTEPGVVRLARPSAKGKRTYVTMTIPSSVAQRVHARLAQVQP